MSRWRENRRFSPGQCRAARGVLGLSVQRLAERAQVSVQAIELYEAGRSSMDDQALLRLGATFANAGVIAQLYGAGREGVRFSQFLKPLGARRARRTASSVAASPKVEADVVGE